MQYLQSLILTRLVNDGALYPSLAVGGIWDRPIKAGPGPGATTSAFYVDPANPSRVHVRPTIYVTAGGQVPATANFTALGAKESFPQVFYYVPTTGNGKDQGDAMDKRVRWLLSPANWKPVLLTGVPIMFTPLEMTDWIEDPDIRGSLKCFRRWRAEYLERD